MGARVSCSGAVCIRLRCLPLPLDSPPPLICPAPVLDTSTMLAIGGSVRRRGAGPADYGRLPVVVLRPRVWLALVAVVCACQRACVNGGEEFFQIIVSESIRGRLPINPLPPPSITSLHTTPLFPDACRWLAPGPSPVFLLYRLSCQVFNRMKVSRYFLFVC